MSFWMMCTWSVSFAKEPYKKRRYSAKETYDFKEPTNRSHPMSKSSGRQHISQNKIVGLFCRISSLLEGSFAKETYDFQEPTKMTLKWSTTYQSKKTSKKRSADVQRRFEGVEATTWLTQIRALIHVVASSHIIRVKRHVSHTYLSDTWVLECLESRHGSHTYDMCRFKGLKESSHVSI